MSIFIKNFCLFITMTVRLAVQGIFACLVGNHVTLTYAGGRGVYYSDDNCCGGEKTCACNEDECDECNKNK